MLHYTMAPRFILKQNKIKLRQDNNVQKYNHILKKNAQLQKQIKLLSIQNKELSVTRNSILQQKMELQNENASLNNSYVQLLAINRTLCEKLNVFDHTLQECVPALITLSKNIPFMLENLHEISKFSKSTKVNIKGNNVKKKKVSLMTNNMTIYRPAISVCQYNLSPIIESSSERTTRQSAKFSTSNSSRRQLDTESYVRMKDVAVLLKNSKSVSHKNSPNQSIENLDEVPSRLCCQETQNQISHNSNNLTKIPEKPYLNLNETFTLDKYNSLNINEVQANMSTSLSTLNDTTSNGRLSELMSPNVTCSISKNITLRKPSNCRSCETINDSDIDTSGFLTRSKRSATKSINYKEQSIRAKLRRN